MTTACRVRELFWTTPSPPADGARIAARIRYRTPAAPATVRREAGDSFLLDFDEPQFAIAPGQAAVLYDGDEVLGGGWIERA